ncbi:MAG: hypothetical protein HY650_04070 [Acidobacteria bacterium]|nr:hypothetical protein [Acidobacteriota bacterium]
MTIQLVTSDAGVAGVVTGLQAADYIGVDCETTHLNPRQGRIRLLQLSTGPETYVLDLFNVSKPALGPLGEILAGDRPVKILHNAKFDAKMLRHHAGIGLGRLFDTYLASRILGAGDPERHHGLADVAFRYLNQQLDKSFQKTDWTGELTEGQLKYAAADAEILLPLRSRLVEEIKRERLIAASRVEFECVVPTAEMELTGIYFDAGRWESTVDDLEGARAILELDLTGELGLALGQLDLFGHPEINLNSPAQVVDAFHRLGIDVRSTRESELAPWAARSPVVARFLEFRGLQKLLSTYGRPLLERVDAETSRIFTDFHQIGTPTGRFSSSEPSVQQIPNLPEIRRCFCAPPGGKLVIADYSQIELRILADFSQDPRMLEAFHAGVDLHRSTASQMFRVPIEQVTRDQRSAAKQINFGLMYGMGAGALASRIDVPLPEAERLLATYFQVYQRVAEWLRSAADTALHTGHIRTKLGRVYRFRVDHQNREQVAMIQRLGKNAPIQGTSADILKRAMRLVHDALVGIDARIVNCVHDEIVVESSGADAERTAEVLRQGMVTAGQEIIETVPIEVEVKISEDWQK